LAQRLRECGKEFGTCNFSTTALSTFFSLSSVSMSSNTGAVEVFSGPHRVGVDHANWDSVSLELRSDGLFSLELWHFYESWDYIPEDGEDVAGIIDRPAPKVDDQSTGVAGVPLKRANHPREVEEVRVTLRGRFVVDRVPAVRLDGFWRQELNQFYTEDSNHTIGGMPTWWSEDGLYFFYFDPDRRHWRANSVRLAGGAGLRAVAPKGRRAGRGVAHSASVTEGENPTAALSTGAGWFEVDRSGIWHPQSVNARTDRVDKFDFDASDIMFDERHTRGVEGALEEKHNAGPVAFRGWRQCGGVRLVMPALPDRIQASVEDDAPVEAIQVSTKPKSGSNFLGDPDTVILRPPKTAKL